jgi:hypothetical protein
MPKGGDGDGVAGDAAGKTISGLDGTLLSNTTTISGINDRIVLSTAS